MIKIRRKILLCVKKRWLAGLTTFTYKSYQWQWKRGCSLTSSPEHHSVWMQFQVIVQQIVMCLLRITRAKRAKSLVGDVVLNHICCLNVPISLKKANVNACTVRTSSMLTSHNSIAVTDDSCEVKHDECNVMTATDVDIGVHSYRQPSSIIERGSCNC